MSVAIAFGLATLFLQLVAHAIYCLSIALVARGFGVQVFNVGIGIGRNLFEKKIGSINFRFGWILLGGSVSLAREAENESSDHVRKPEPGDYDAASLPIRIVILLAGPLSCLLIGLILLGCPVLLGSKQLAVTTPENSIVHPCSLAGLIQLSEPTGWEGQWTFFRDTWVECLLKLFTFESLEGYGYTIGYYFTSGLIAEKSVAAWFTMVAGLFLINGIMNLLPIPLLNGGRILLLLIEATVRPFGARLMIILKWLGLIFNLTCILRLFSTDFIWLWKNEPILAWMLIGYFVAGNLIIYVRCSPKKPDTEQSRPTKSISEDQSPSNGDTLGNER